MDKKFLLSLQKRNNKRLLEIRSKIEKGEVEEEDLEALEKEAKELAEEQQEIADELARLTDDPEPEPEPSEPTEPEPSDPEPSSEPGEPEARTAGMISPEQRDRLNNIIAQGIEARGRQTQERLESEIRSAFANFVVGNISEQEARSLGVEAGNGRVTIPSFMATEIITYAQEENFMRRLGTRVTTKENITYPILVKKATAQGHKKERDSSNPIPVTSIEFDEVELEPTEFDALAKVTLKLLKRTGLPIEQIVLDELKKAYVEKEVQYMVNGDEVGNENPGALAKKAVEFKAVTDEEFYDSLVRMKNTPKKAVRKKARWVLNTAALTKIETMRGKDGALILRPLESPVEGCNYKLLGHLVEEEDSVDKTGSPDVPVFYFGNFQQFFIQDVIGSLEIQKLVEKFSDTNEVGFKIYNLLDAQLIYSPFEPAMYRYEVAK
ncbi:phage major capsid protein [Vagococcus carniphilus]|uniref:phage major capsid protein n=1 Tax=Vagococcus carniphilus TaxID=218144 RepID=UPI00288CEF61|nr:phage major capsid protein [Vagococcus carniphilus]MDT2850173.1 phage major capsid protein [Vagococcus carniphilus]